jgi:hypothetical protein
MTINNKPPSPPDEPALPRVSKATEDRGCVVGCLLAGIFLLLAMIGLVWLILALYRALRG